jgi:hypothetical protein
VRAIAADPGALEAALASFVGREAWVHAEWIPGGFLRNVRVEVAGAYLRGTGPYRVALRCAGGAWVRIEDVTDWELDGAGRVCLLAFGDAEQRLSRTLEVSPRPLPA